MKTAIASIRNGQRGVTAIEFALVATAFFILLVGIMEMGRVLFYWNTAAEVTRLGARIAVVCDKDDADIKAKMVALFPTLSIGDIAVIYQPSGCTAGTCEMITVSVAAGTPIDTFIPFVPLSLAMPAFTTTLTRESMNSGGGNPVCQ